MQGTLHHDDVAALQGMFRHLLTLGEGINVIHNPIQFSAGYTD